MILINELSPPNFGNRDKPEHVPKYNPVTKNPPHTTTYYLNSNITSDIYDNVLDGSMGPNFGNRALPPTTLGSEYHH